MSGTGGQEISAKIKVMRIETAPVTVGVPWGPCLLAPGIDGEWTIGEWDGEGWFARSGFRIAPAYYGELPSLNGRVLDPAHDF